MHLTKRQKQVYDFIREYLERHGYAPSLEETAKRFNLSSVATVHKHVQNLVEKGLLRKSWNRSRSIEVVDVPATVQVPFLGSVAAGVPIEAITTSDDTIGVPESMVGTKKCYALRVQGESMIDDHILDGDVVLLEHRIQPREGETVVALVRSQEVTLKRFYTSGSRVRLVPANEKLQPMEFPADEVEFQGVVIGLIRQY
jgi:repressor LexA